VEGVAEHRLRNSVYCQFQNVKSPKLRPLYVGCLPKLIIFLRSEASFYLSNTSSSHVGDMKVEFHEFLALKGDEWSALLALDGGK